MKLLVLLAFLVVANSQVSVKRQDSLDVLNQLRQNIPDHQYAQDAAILRIFEAKQKTSNALNNFYHNVFEMKQNSLQSMLDLELDTLSYGAKVDDWCWENNIPMLEGIMGWIGADYSDCIKQLDNSIADIVSTIYGRFYDDETNVKEYRLFEVFHRRNIINNPQSIADAISNLKYDVTDAIPNLDGIVSRFENDLNDKLPSYSCCLNNKLSNRKQQIEELKIQTERCLAEQA